MAIPEDNDETWKSFLKYPETRSGCEPAKNLAVKVLFVMEKNLKITKMLFSLRLVQ